MSDRTRLLPLIALVPLFIVSKAAGQSPALGETARARTHAAAYVADWCRLFEAASSAPCSGTLRAVTDFVTSPSLDSVPTRDGIQQALTYIATFDTASADFAASVATLEDFAAFVNFADSVTTFGDIAGGATIFQDFAADRPDVDAFAADTASAAALQEFADSADFDTFAAASADFEALAAASADVAAGVATLRGFASLRAFMTPFVAPVSAPVGATTVSPVAVAFAATDFLIERARAELVLSTFHQIDDSLDTGHLGILLPHTAKLFKAADELDYRALMPTFRAALKEDFKVLPRHLADYVASTTNQTSPPESPPAGVGDR